MSDTFKKDFIGVEDLNRDTNRSNETFSRETSTGGSQILNKVNAKHIPITTEIDWNGATNVHEALAEAKRADDELQVFLTFSGNWDSYLGVFATVAALLAAHPAPTNVDLFAFVDETGSFWYWDQSLGTPAWANIYKGYPSGRTAITPTATQDIDFSLGNIFDLGVLTQNVTLTFSNIIVGQQIVINFTTTALLTVTLPTSVKALEASSVRLSAYNSITLTATDGVTVQEGRFSTDLMPVNEEPGSGIVPEATNDVDDANFVAIGDNLGSRFKLVNATADRTATVDPAIFTSEKDVLHFKNDSVGFIFKVIVDNVATDTIKNTLTEIDLAYGDMLTLSGDSSTNIDLLTINLSGEDAASGEDNNQTGTTYTIVRSDGDNKTVWMDNSSSNVVSIPLNSVEPMPIGIKIPVMQGDVGETTVTGVTGVTVNGVSAGSKVNSGQYAGLLLQKRATDEWIVTG
jgi:hypothetical protein